MRNSEEHTKDPVSWKVAFWEVTLNWGSGGLMHTEWSRVCEGNIQLCRARAGLLFLSHFKSGASVSKIKQLTVVLFYNYFFKETSTSKDLYCLFEILDIRHLHIWTDHTQSCLLSVVHILMQNLRESPCTVLRLLFVRNCQTSCRKSEFWWNIMYWLK